MDELEIELNDISETLLLPLYARAIESKSKNPIIIDNKAIEITQELNKKFKSSESKLHKTLLKGQVRKRLGKKLNVTLSLRTRKFDMYCADFLSKNPSGIIVELGCGLSTRFLRIDNQKVQWYDLDLPEVIDIKKSFFKETERYMFIRSSVLDFTWMDHIEQKNKPTLFIAEGLLMYLPKEEVKKLILDIQKKFPNSEFICEVANSYIIKMLKRKLWRRKFQRDFHLGENATFLFGITDSTEMEEWGPGIEFIEEWTYFDEKEKKLGWINLFGKIEKLRKAQWIVKYRLNSLKK